MHHVRLERCCVKAICTRRRRQRDIIHYKEYSGTLYNHDRGIRIYMYGVDDDDDDEQITLDSSNVVFASSEL